MKVPFRVYPQISLRKLGQINFFPTFPKDLEWRPSICIGTKSNALGDALILTTLPRKLKRKYPRLKIYIYPKAFNPVVFAGNPYVDGVQYLPRELYGDDINDGAGNLILTKERFFGLEMGPVPKPEIYPSSREEKWARQVVLNRRFLIEPAQGKPLILIHPWGGTCQNVLKKDLWAQVMSEFSSHARFWQIGIQGHEKIPGCENHFFFRKNFWSARKLFALVSQSDGLIGVDSGPMHVARALDKPSLIFSDYCPIEELFSNLRNSPYYLYQNYLRGCLYEENHNVFVGGYPNEDEIMQHVQRYLELRSEACPTQERQSKIPASSELLLNFQRAEP